MLLLLLLLLLITRFSAQRQVLCKTFPFNIQPSKLSTTDQCKPMTGISLANVHLSWVAKIHLQREIQSSHWYLNKTDIYSTNIRRICNMKTIIHTIKSIKLCYYYCKCKKFCPKPNADISKVVKFKNTSPEESCELTSVFSSSTPTFAGMEYGLSGIAYLQQIHSTNCKINSTRCTALTVLTVLLQVQHDTHADVISWPTFHPLTFLITVLYCLKLNHIWRV